MPENNEVCLYGVSTGDGNNGVSHMFANYYVRTADPWLLARAAAYAEWQPAAWDYLDSELRVDGEAEYTISAMLYEAPDFEPPTVDCPDCYDGQVPVDCHVCEGSGLAENDTENCPHCAGTGMDTEDCPNCDGTGQVPEEYYENGPAAFILEVFPENEPREGRPVYDSIEDALGADAIERARKE